MNLQPQRATRILINTMRDRNGHLVSLTIGCGLGITFTSSNAWSVAVDGCRHSQRAISEVVRLATKMNDVHAGCGELSSLGVIVMAATDWVPPKAF